MNYSQLVSLIQEFTETDETTFVNNIPNFVKLAEERIMRHVKLPKMTKLCSTSIVQGTEFFSAPTDFISVDSMDLLSSGTYSHLSPKEPSFLREAYPASASTGKPLYYSMLDENTIQIAPISDATYTIRMQYMSKPQSIVDSSTSWIGDNCENALLYGSLVNAYIFLKGEEGLIKTYSDMFAEAVGLTAPIAEVRNKTDEWRSPPRPPMSRGSA